MNLKNISIILALLSFQVKVFSSTIKDTVSEGEKSAVEVLDAEISDDAFETFNVDTVLEDDINGSDSELENLEVSTDTVNEDIGDIPCDSFYSCMDWINENKDILGFTDEILQYTISQYEAGESVKFIKEFKNIDYGMKVEVNGHQMNVDIKGEGNDKTIVVLTGLSAPSPVIFYKDITDILSTNFKVVTIEPFGYGLSDQVTEERTTENIVTEIHSCLEKLGIDRYYLLGHSIGGLYSIVFDDKYPNEVLGFIGLDNTPSYYYRPEMQPLPEFLIPLIKINYKYQLYALYPKEMTFEVDALLEMAKTYQNYTEEDLKIIETNLKYNYNSPNIINEINHLLDNIVYTEDMHFHCPTLMFLTSEINDNDSEWMSLHEALITNPEKSEIFVVDALHNFIHSQQRDFIVDKINEWINRI